MKIRLLPVVSTFFISGCLLFGGWFAYQSLAIENPIDELVQSVPGVKEAQIESSRDEFHIRLRLEQDANLGTLYNAIFASSMEEIGDRALTIEIADDSSVELDRIWSALLFDIAEAMDTHRYGTIPTLLNKVSQPFGGLFAEASMDETNVYVTLRLDGKSKYVILPRTPAKMGVWPNEPLQ